MAIGKREVEYEIQNPGQEPEMHRMEADTVVLAVGQGPNPAVAQRLKKAGVLLREIGDVSGPGYLEGAIHDGFRAALEL